MAVIYLVAHARWAPGRIASLSRLLEQLPSGRTEVFTSYHPEHACQWARRIYQAAAAIDGPVCILNDDVRITSPEDIEACHLAAPDECLSLCCTNPNVPLPVDVEAHLRWLETGEGEPWPERSFWARAYHYSGPGVVLPRGAAESLLAFTATLPWSFVSRTNEDNIANAWAWDRQRPFFYPLPSPVDHDPGIPSTLGYDDHPNRTAIAFGQAERPPPKDPPFVELRWAPTQTLRYQREVIREDRKLCTFCLGREGKVGNKTDMLCIECLTGLTVTALRNTK